MTTTRTRVHIGALVVFALTLAGATWAVHAAWTRTSLSRFRMEIVEAPQPAADDSYYVAHDRGGHVDHHVLYHGVDATSHERLTSADVLLLGNSRLMFALDRPALRGFFPRVGLSYFMLGFGHNETNEFPQALIARFDLHPRLVIVNADRFFVADQSAWADRVREESWFDAWKRYRETEVSHAVRRAVHRVVPHVPDIASRQREFITYRSRLDGSWWVANQFQGLAGWFDGTIDGEFNEIRDVEWEAAAAFKRMLDARGTALVLTLVPSPRASRARALRMAEHLGVPLVSPRLPDLTTVDGSHLTRESADRFAEAFFAGLEPVLDDLGLVRAAADGAPRAGRAHSVE